MLMQAGSAHGDAKLKANIHGQSVSCVLKVRLYWPMLSASGVSPVALLVGTSASSVAQKPHSCVDVAVCHQAILRLKQASESSLGTAHHSTACL